MTRTPLYVHLEGMDLAGKTTARVALSKAMGPDCRVRHNSICDANPIYELADRLRKEDSAGVETLGYLYVAALAADLEHWSPPPTHTIQDSTIVLRSLAYHKIVGTPFVADAMMTLLPRHPRFTRSFVLTASLDVRRQRLKERQCQQPDEIAADDLQILRAPERFLAMEAALIDLAQRHFDAMIIDTSELTPAGVLNSIIHELPETD
jgi:thymidylate kinase